MREVRPIFAEETVAIRWPVLRPGFPRETAVFDGDDGAMTQHLGAFEEERMVGVASVYLAAMPGRDEPATWQLRGMATLPEVRGRGHGKALVAACEAAVRDAGGVLLWCNARVLAAPFYERLGWRITGGIFDIPTVGPHFVMWRQLAP